jgi:hypothetical protein
MPPPQFCLWDPIEVIDCPMSDPQSVSLGGVVMGRPINRVMCRMAVAVLPDAHVFDEAVENDSGRSFSIWLSKVSANSDKFSKT